MSILRSEKNSEIVERNFTNQQIEMKINKNLMVGCWASELAQGFRELAAL